MSADTIGLALVLLGLILLVAKGIRVSTPLVQKLFLPSSIIGGAVALLLGPEVLGALGERMGTDRFSEAGIYTPEILDVWSALPGLLISVIFATLFLGSEIPTPSACSAWSDRRCRWA